MTDEDEELVICAYSSLPIEEPGQNSPVLDGGRCPP